MDGSVVYHWIRSGGDVFFAVAVDIVFSSSLSSSSYKVL